MIIHHLIIDNVATWSGCTCCLSIGLVSVSVIPGIYNTRLGVLFSFLFSMETIMLVAGDQDFSSCSTETITTEQDLLQQQKQLQGPQF